MFRIILDTNAIVQDPDILSVKPDDGEFIVPRIVLDELSSMDAQSASGSAYVSHVHEAVESGSTRVLHHPDLSIEDIANPSMVVSDQLIIETAKNIKSSSPSDEVIIVSDDRYLRDFITEQEIDAISVHDLVKNYIKKKPKNERVEQSAVKIRAYQRKHLVQNVIISFLAGFLVIILASNISLIISTIRIWGTVTLIPILGVFLYWVRNKKPLGYGITEIIVGLIASVRVFLPTFNYEELHAIQFLQVIGGLYIIVRGLNNVGNGLEGSKYGEKWKHFFTK